MLDKLLSLLPNKKQRALASVVGGMIVVLTGRKIIALTLFGRGLSGLEKEWRLDHPDVKGFDARWQEATRFYDETHRDPTNRKLHVVGIPMILGGAAGLLLYPAFRPFWFASAGSFAAGWALNIVGHVLFEKKAPAFADDPLSFVAGPVWDLRKLFDKAENDDADVADAFSSFTNGHSAPHANA